VTRYLLDTNIVSEMRKLKPDRRVVAWVSGLHDDQIFISALTIGELQRGIERMRRQNPSKAGEIELWVDDLEKSYNLLSMDAPCFREWARLMEGKSDQLLEDAMIAATARVHTLRVATRNQKDFALLGADTVNPFRIDL